MCHEELASSSWLHKTSCSRTPPSSSRLSSAGSGGSGMAALDELLSSGRAAAPTSERGLSKSCRICGVTRKEIWRFCESILNHIFNRAIVLKKHLSHFFIHRPRNNQESINDSSEFWISDTCVVIVSDHDLIRWCTSIWTCIWNVLQTNHTSRAIDTALLKLVDSCALLALKVAFWPRRIPFSRCQKQEGLCNQNKNNTCSCRYPRHHTIPTFRRMCVSGNPYRSVLQYFVV